ncbi:MAG: HWE histidine kinase domain-containing protein, partial [Pseudomonadota bacterium]
ELSHRTRNQLAALSSVIRYTSTSAASVKTFADKLDARIQAMGLTQSLLVEADWTGVSLRDLIESHFQLCLPADVRTRLDGPRVVVAPEPAQNLGLAFHEFAQNVRQQNEGGERASVVRTMWAYDTETGSVVLSLREYLADPKQRGTQIGFGTMMFRKVLPAALGIGAEADVDYTSDGARARITIPKACLAG